jgi:hypothetical protein
MPGHKWILGTNMNKEDNQEDKRSNVSNVKVKVKVTQNRPRRPRGGVEV